MCVERPSPPTRVDRDEACAASLWVGVKSPNFSSKYHQYELDRAGRRSRTATDGAAVGSRVTALLFPSNPRHFLDSIPQVIDGEAQGVGDDLHGVESRIGLAVLDTA